MGQVTMRKYSILDSILGEHLVGINSIVIEDTFGKHKPDDTLVFRLKDGRRFQLIVDQTNKVFREMMDNNDIELWGEYDRIDLKEFEPIDIGDWLLEDGLVIKQISEFWANDGNKQFLMGVILADPSEGKDLSILTGGTEVELVSKDMFYTVLKEMAFPYEVVNFTSSKSRTC